MIPSFLSHALFLVVVLVAFRYAWLRIRVVVPKRLRWFGGTAFIGIIFLAFAYRLLPEITGPQAQAMLGMGAFWMVFIGNWLVACLFMDLLFVILWIKARVWGFGLRSREIVFRLKLARDHWIPQALILTVLVTIGFCVYGWNKQLNFIVHYETLEIKKPAAEAIRIAVISDAHFDPLFRAEKWDRLIDSLDRIQPDLIVLLGDMSDLSIHDLEAAGFADGIQKLHAPLGVFGITGNHEAYMMRRDPELLHWMQLQGMELLDESSVCMMGLCLTGRADPQMAKQNNEARKPLAKIQPDSIWISRQAWIVLDHQPKGLEPSDLPASAPRPDLGLSGHTHGGQFFPWTIVINWVWPLANGRGTLTGVPWITSSGFGQWGPALRVGSSTELLIIDLVPKK
jgi:predicted MPP superfamily phosphohydrolase